MAENISFKDDSTYLLMQIKKLEQRTQELEAEKRDWFFERERLQREVQVLRAEIEKLTVPPYVEGYITDLLPDGRAVVKSSTGPSLVVNIMRTV
ncbi:MAG: hypothetical protein NQU41_05950, partial [Candidatus Methanosuratincola sp.]|nr:hypothetical protein [Candidatus Methanosuratincola sp.]